MPVVRRVDSVTEATKKICIENHKLSGDEQVFIPGINGFGFGDHSIDAPEERVAAKAEINNLQNIFFSEGSLNETHDRYSDNKRNDSKGNDNGAQIVNAPGNVAMDNSSEKIFYSRMLTPTNPMPAVVPVSKNAPSYMYPPLQCKLCGLRYLSDRTEEFGIHIEDHRRKNRALDDKMVLGREFFTSKALKTTVKLNLNMNSHVEAIVWNRESPRCRGYPPLDISTTFS